MCVPYVRTYSQERRHNTPNFITTTRKLISQSDTTRTYVRTTASSGSVSSYLEKEDHFFRRKKREDLGESGTVLRTYVRMYHHTVTRLFSMQIIAQIMYGTA